MAEPLLRKTFSRLRGREKLPRKKSDAKERGERGRWRRRGARPHLAWEGVSRGPKEGPLRGLGKPSGAPCGPGLGAGVSRGPGSNGLGGEGARTVMCAWPGMPALRAPWEALEGASPLTGNGAEAERLESGGEEEVGG